MDIKRLKLSSPWAAYCYKLNAMFGHDPDIRIDYDDDGKVLTLVVNGTDKANALTALLPAEKDFGGVILRTVIKPEKEEKDKADLIEAALKGNPCFGYVLRIDEGLGKGTRYVMFRKDIAQYWNDNLGHPNGYESHLYQDLAYEIFGSEPGTFYCTETNGECLPF